MSALEQQVRVFALGRIGVGASFLLAPGLCLRMSLGAVEVGPVTRMLARSVGARDIALGLGALFALRHDAPLRGWLEAGTLADAGDAVTTVLALPHLGKGRAALAVLSAASSVVLGRRLVGELPAPAPPPVPAPTPAPAAAPL
jgi:hypothetical protein